MEALRVCMFVCRCPKESYLHLPVQPELRGGQGQTEPVSVLPPTKVLQGGHEEGSRTK